jgi:Response regulator containing CheY-like receiver domain and AraC-type DNA-binding domain
MNYNELDKKLKSSLTYSNRDDKELLNHFQKKFAHVPFNDELLFVFNTDREFHNSNHIIALHPRKSGKVPMHIFHYIVITYVYQGSLTITVENEVITLNEGDIILFDKHVPHSVAATTENDLGINIILHENYFHKKFINQLPNEQLISKFILELMNRQNRHNHYLLFYTEKDYLVHNCIQNILCEQLFPSVCSDDLIDNFIMILITHLVRKFKYDTNLSVKMFKNQELMDDILNYIKKNYREGNLKQMCQEFGYNPSYASKLIKQFSGRTFKSLVMEERMKMAIILLHNNLIPIYEVAEKIGISNLTTFYKKFHEFAGCTPQQYRNKYKK